MENFIKIIFVRITGGFNHGRYWKIRDCFFNSKKNSFLFFYYKYYLRKINNKQSADINFDYELGQNFESPPIFNSHGISGVIIAATAHIGKNCFISHQVTIGGSKNGFPTIGDNVYIGPGAKIFGNIKIGNNVRIGANCVVFEDVPDNATIVLSKPRIIIKDVGNEYYTFKIEDKSKKKGLII